MDSKEKDTEKDINELKKKAGRAKKYGQSLQKEGGGLIQKAEQLDSFLDFIELKKLLKEHEIQSWAASANATIPSQPPQNLPQINTYNLAFGTTASTASLSCYAYYHVFPSQHIEQVREQNKIINIKLNIDEENELVGYIEEFNAAHSDVGDLLSMRTSAWQILNSPIEAKYMFASHSMREILSKVISAGASNEKVKKANWWKFDGKIGVTLRQRLRYLIFGSLADRQNEDILETINLSVEKAFDADEQLKKVAHGSKPDKKEVEQAMFVTERTLLNIFRYKKIQKG